MRVIAAVSAIAVGLTACGGSGDKGTAKGTTTSSKPAAEKSTTTAAPKVPQRPEGDWALVRWQIEPTKGEANEVRYKMAPVCAEGPCDIKVTGAGPNGSFFPEGYPGEDATSGPAGQSFDMRWDAATKTYKVESEEVSFCLDPNGEEVPEGFTVKTSASYTFTPETGTTPAAIHADRERVGTPTPKGEAAGCKVYTEKTVVAGAPIGAFDKNPPSLAGSYRTTLVIEEATPPEEGKVPGAFASFDEPMTITDEAGSYLLKGTTEGPAKLTASGEGSWSGAASTDKDRCSEGTGNGEYTTTETWTGLKVVALTDAGAPILSGRRDWVADPNPAGLVAGCEKSTERGWVTLIPAAALG